MEVQVTSAGTRGDISTHEPADTEGDQGDEIIGRTLNAAIAGR